MLREAFPSQKREGFCTVHVQLDVSLQYCFKVLGVSAKVLVLWKGSELLKTTEVAMFSMVSHANNQPPKHQQTLKYIMYSKPTSHSFAQKHYHILSVQSW
ncbi:hypothetical protein Bbelb_325130 [Branchiostoma belcheri]|nr:hypothetical protein Bbelb_325130 [Branchiostoma belcheri]